MPQFRHIVMVGLAACLSGSGLWILTTRPVRPDTQAVSMAQSAVPTLAMRATVTQSMMPRATITPTPMHAPVREVPTALPRQNNVSHALAFAPPLTGNDTLYVIPIDDSLRGLLPPAPVDLLSIKPGSQQPVRRIAMSLPVTAITHTERQSWVWFALSADAARLLTIAEAEGARLIVTRARVADEVMDLDRDLLPGLPRQFVRSQPTPILNLSPSIPQPAVLPDTSGGDFFGETGP